jgi:hypothetical protein
MKSLRSPRVSALLVAVVALFVVEAMLHCADHAGLLAGGHSHHHGCEELPFSNDGDTDGATYATDGHTHFAMPAHDSFRLESRLPISGMSSSPNALPPSGAIREITHPPRLS